MAPGSRYRVAAMGRVSFCVFVDGTKLDASVEPGTGPDAEGIGMGQEEAQGDVK